MIKFENTQVLGFEPAIRGMRNPKNSWDRSDSGYCETHGPEHCASCPHSDNCNCDEKDVLTKYIIGPNDMKLMKGLRNAGTDHRKFMRMITVYVDITAPLYWWKEFDTYKVGTVANSCSTMHKIADKEFTMADFSCEHLADIFTLHNVSNPLNVMEHTIFCLNFYRDLYLKEKDKKYWWKMIQLLPSSYNQKRTVMMNYEVLANIYKSRKNHKLDEWAEHKCIDGFELEYYGFCDWIKSLPYSELITGEFKD